MSNVLDPPERGIDDKVLSFGPARVEGSHSSKCVVIICGIAVVFCDSSIMLSMPK